MSAAMPPSAAVDGHAAPGAPSSWVCRWAHLVATGGAVLDVASGAGRHARWFASRGHPVTAIDCDTAALATLMGVPNVATLAADLEDHAPDAPAPWPLPAGTRFAAVVVTNYLHRPLFPHLADALAPGGVLLYETFAQGNETVGKPSRPAFLLAPGELLDAARARLRVVAYEDGFAATPRPAFIQRICAVREVHSVPDQPVDPAGFRVPPRYGLPG